MANGFVSPFLLPSLPLLVLVPIHVHARTCAPLHPQTRKLTPAPLPGLRRNRRLPLRLPRPPLPNPLLLAHPVRVGGGHDPLHPVDRAVWLVWQHVHQGGRAGRRGDPAYEARGVGGSCECAAVAD
jgi:hypothetical protein